VSSWYIGRMKEWRFEFSKFIAAEVNDRSIKQIESHFAFIRQLLTVCIAGIGFMSVLIREEGIPDSEIKLIRFIIISLSLCTLSCLILLFGQKYIYGQQIEALKKYKREVLDAGSQDGKSIDVPVDKFFVATEKACYLLFCMALFVLIWYSATPGA